MKNLSRWTVVRWVVLVGVVALMAQVVLAADMTDMTGMPGMSAADHAAVMHGQPEPTGSFLGRLFETYVPRKMCMNYEPDVIWLHIVADSIIATSYYTIPLALLYFVRRRKDLAFNWMFVAFAMFILLCGTTHVFNVIAIWQPYYRLDGVIKAFTALVSIGTAIALWKLIPQALAIPSPATLRIANEKLQTLTDELETRVEQRTAELASSLQREKVARKEAESASRLKDEFVATLSHELRTPVNAVLGWTGILRRKTATPDDYAEGLEIIERNTRVQMRLIEDLLDMSRILSGKLRLDLEKMGMGEVIAAAIETVRPAVEAKGIRVVQTVDPSVPTITGDFNRLQQVVWNLLSNAVKFTPKGGTIRVGLRQVESQLEIVVADDGMGIQPAFLPHVFERFRQQDASTTRTFGGLGLGLAIVRHLAELHGGSVSVTSEGENRGSTFTVMLPIPAVHVERAAVREPAVSDVEEIERLAIPRLDGVKVLVVDDEADARSLLKHQLEGQGAEVSTAGSAREAYERIRESRPDVIVSDIGMPGEDGYALIRKVRSWTEAEGGRTPAVALTAFASADDRSRALLAGFNLHMKKPAEALELLAVVASLSGRLREAQ